LTEKDVDGRRVGGGAEEVEDGGRDDEGERERKEEDDGESKEVTRVSVDDSFGFREDGP